MKRCSRCTEDKPLDEFAQHNKLGHQSYCRGCKASYQREWYARKTKEERTVVNRARRDRYKDRLGDEAYQRDKKSGDLKYRYGITIEDYDALLATQGEVCAICGTDDWEAHGNRTSPVVDHCHETGRVRGLLCNKCNLLIGYANDEPERLRSAISYLVRELENREPLPEVRNRKETVGESLEEQ